jgi:hypothetical protein
MEFDEGAAEEIRENTLTGSIVTRTLGGNSPTHYFNDRTDGLQSEGIDGQALDTVSGDEINSQSFVDSYAAGMLAGNSDLHGGNFVVDEGGEAWLIDHDRAEGRTEGFADRTLDDFDEFADELGLEVSSDDVEERLIEMAENAPDYEEELPFSTAGRIQENISWAQEELA